MPYILRTAYLIPDEALPRKGFSMTFIAEYQLYKKITVQLSDKGKEGVKKLL